MQYDELIGEVQHRAQLDSREAALSTTRATLETLSERIQPGEAENLAGQLPEELGRHLENVDDVERFDLETFVERVAERESLGGDDYEDVAYRSRVVMEVLDEAVTGSVMTELKSQLPDEYDDLFALQETEATAGPDSE
ncbi:DUF2267 domain-containing protein [Natronosalvus caseinilyticus]|uniref:DUF2267 domain-containing protein n=1 Tax=Natronosalvus caseinilyticus TaxID=2953747 RepID=UPI0028AB10F8|nr:DUF2267 domain-containing protein [Natronosalvus caseinilyticus]